MPVGAYGGRATDAADRAQRPDLPGRHAQRQSGGDGRGTGDAGTDPGAGLPRRARSQHARLCDGLEAAAREAGVAVTTNRSCAMFGLFFTDEKVETFADADGLRRDAFNRFFHGMLERGVYLAPSAFEAGFLSSAHGEAEIAHTLKPRAKLSATLRQAD